MRARVSSPVGTHSEVSLVHQRYLPVYLPAGRHAGGSRLSCLASSFNCRARVFSLFDFVFEY